MMNRIYLCLLVLFIHGYAWAGGGVPPAQQDIPVAPVKAVELFGFTNAYILKNAQIQVAVVPDIGRIVFAGPDAENNLLRFNMELTGTGPTDGDNAQWLNYGGDWLWPVSQRHWPEFQSGDWPPSRLLDGRPWDGRAWQCADKTLCCLITQEFGEPLNLKISRQIRLPADTNSFYILQRMERTGESDIPVTLWNISQVRLAERVLLPVDDTSVFEKGFTPMMFDAPPDNAVIRNTDCIVYETAEGGEAKLCSDSRQAWIAAQRDEWVILEQIENPRFDGVFPDGGCTVEMYANSGLGYAEIETLSIERVLKPGEYLENRIRVDIFPLQNERRTARTVAQEVLQRISASADGADE
jgi:hypothetical protein